ncbi:alpha/beta hydrolase [Aestuariibacter sp. AA17]|uniref:Alpha/beta hydrolase n=1 Tax=Fluctibacter corallii TaxID=2984329 RepID=A0ABT3A9I8_9ALTE|nr:alpha/beta hydrolase [Aestuariibacter sp. AA17]MCV2885264.1 alpha/beta hydrolase [Aestuariibacter sp. AA17]
MNRFLAFMLIFVCTFGCADEIIDSLRDRSIPIDVSVPLTNDNCSNDMKCPVIFLSAGYGVPHTKYQFLSSLFSELGYLVVAIRHELPMDPPLSVSGNLFETRKENWIRGAETLNIVRDKLQVRYRAFDFNTITLVGHSNGGDISAWLLRKSPSYVKQIITLDHRRVPLPRTSEIKVLSLRASDFKADEGVLPSKTEQSQYGSCVIKIENARHNDMSDYGPAWLKSDIQKIIKQWLRSQSCTLKDETT